MAYAIIAIIPPGFRTFYGPYKTRAEAQKDLVGVACLTTYSGELAAEIRKLNFVIREPQIVNGFSFEIVNIEEPPHVIERKHNEALAKRQAGG